MIEVPENGSIWVSGVGVLIALYSVFRDTGKQNGAAIEKKIKELVDPVQKALDGHKTDYGLFKTGIDTTLRDHVVYRRDFEDYKRDQLRTIERLEEGLRREFTEMREMLGKITDMLIKRGAQP